MLKILWMVLRNVLFFLKYPRNIQEGEEKKGQEIEGELRASSSMEILQQVEDVWDGNPDDFLPSPPKKPSFFSNAPKAYHHLPASLLVVVWLGLSFYQWSNPGWTGAVSRRSLFADHEYWRLLTALAVHSDLGHLLSNTPLFLVFGFYLKGFFGTTMFPVAALFAGIVTNFFTVLLYPAEVKLLGASGMLYAMVAMWLVLYMKFETQLKWGVKLLRTVGVALLLLFPTTFQPQTSYLAHGLGFCVGLLFAVLFIALPRKKDPYVAE